jgi:hypothetical protein
MFIATLFTIAKLWYQLTNGWMDKGNVLYTQYTGDIIKPSRRMKSWHLQENGWN